MEKNSLVAVGELPSHSHTAAINTIDVNGKVWSIAGTNGNSIQGGSTGCFSLSHTVVSDVCNGQTGSSSANDTINFNFVHNHTITIDNIGSNTAHNNLQPYYACYIWQRVS